MELGNMKGGGWYEADDLKIGDMWTSWYPFFDEIFGAFYLHSFADGPRTTFQCEPVLSEVTKTLCGVAEAVSRWLATFVEKEGCKRSGHCVREFVKAEAVFVILWKLYCENYTVTVTVTILYYIILWRPAETLGESILLYTILYC